MHKELWNHIQGEFTIKFEVFGEWIEIRSLRFKKLLSKVV